RLRLRARPVLPLPVRGAAAARAGTELLRGRRPRRPARDHRFAPGERGPEGAARSRRDAGRAAPPDRRADDRVQRGPRPEEPGLPRLRRVADDHRLHRLRAVLLRHEGGRVTTIRIPPTLRASVGGEREVPVEGATVRDLLEDLTTRFPAL